MTSLLLSCLVFSSLLFSSLRSSYLMSSHLVSLIFFHLLSLLQSILLLFASYLFHPLYSSLLSLSIIHSSFSSSNHILSFHLFLSSPSLTNSLIRSFTQSLTYSLAHSLTHAHFLPPPYPLFPRRGGCYYPILFPFDPLHPFNPFLLSLRSSSSPPFLSDSVVASLCVCACWHPFAFHTAAIQRRV